MGQSTKMSNTGLQQQGSVGNGAPPAMVPAAGGASVTVGSGNGPKKARSGYNAKAMAEIRNSLRPYEDSNPTNGQLNMANLVGMQTGSITVNSGPTGVRPVSSLSTGSSSNSNYSDCIQSLMNLGFDEESSSVALNQGNGNVTVALDLLKSQQRLRMDSLQLQNGDLINGPGRPTRILRNHAIDQQHNPQQPTMVIADGTPINQIRSESPAVVINSNGVSKSLQASENINSQAPPALPPRSSQKEPPPRIPAHPSISNPSGIPISDAPSVSINNHSLIGRKYSPNGTIGTVGSTNTVIVQSTDAPPLPPPRGAQNPPPTPPPVHPRGVTPPPATVGTSTSVQQQLNNHTGGLNPPQLLKRMSPIPGVGTRVTMQPLNGNVSTAPIYTQSSQSRDDSPPIGNTSASGHPQPVRPKNSQEIQQQLQQQLQTMASNLQPNWLCENNAEPPPPYPMGTAAVTANPPPSYSQSMTMRQSPTLSMSSTSSDYRRSPAPPLPANQFINPYSNHQFTNHQILSNGNTAQTNSANMQPAIVSATPVVQQGQFISVQSPLPTSPSPSVMSSYSGTSSSMYGHGLATRKVQTHSPVIMQSVKSTQVQKPVLQTATGIPTMTGAVSDASQQQIIVQSQQAVLATPATGMVHHGIATSVAVPLQQQPQPNIILNSNNVNGVGGKITPIGTHVTDGVATPPPPSYEFSMQQKQQQQRTSPVVATRHPMHMPSPVTVPRMVQQSPATLDKGVAPSPLPPPPPYPSTAVSLNNNQQCHDINQQLVNGTSVSAKPAPVVISTAKVVGTNIPASSSSNANLVRTIETKHSVLQRKYSPLTSETGSSTAASRSESPISDSHTVSAASPLSFSSSTSATNNVVNTTLCNMNNNITNYELNSSNTAPTSDVENFSSLPPSLPSNANTAAMAPPQASSASLSMPQPPPYRPTHHVSPKPERRQISAAKEEMRKESLIKSCPPQAFKFFMEQHIENVIKEYEKRRDRRMRLERELEQVMRGNEGIQINEETKEKMRMALTRKETNYLRMRRAKLNKSHFKKIKDIGVGAFGKVSLVRSVYGCGQNRPGGLYAMKTLKKNHVLAKNQVAHVWSEKDILSEADNDWIVKLYYSFQDQHNLYFVMEYIPGGDLMSMLIKEGTFSEERSRFYIAELTCAVESVHALRFIHRDIKPDNILIDAHGHIKLTDFGLCTGFRWTHNSESYQSKNGHAQHYRQDSMDPMNMDLTGGNCSCPLSANGLKPLERRRRKQEQREIAHSLVGTPNYIAPEILSRRGYTQTCDWWSVGVILYEMIIGRPPFNGEDNRKTQMKVIHWKENLNVPPYIHTGNGNETRAVSPEAMDLIKKLCCDPEHRLGTQNGASDIKLHPFFNGVNFRHIRKTRAPPEAIPRIAHPEDTSNFDTEEIGIMDSDDEENNDHSNYGNGQKQGGSSRDSNLDNNHQGFYEFTFRRFFDDGGYPLQNCPLEPFSDPSPEERPTYV